MPVHMPDKYHNMPLKKSKYLCFKKKSCRYDILKCCYYLKICYKLIYNIFFTQIYAKIWHLKMYNKSLKKSTILIASQSRLSVVKTINKRTPNGTHIKDK